MAQVSIVFFSGYGHTKVQAEAVADGAKSVDGAEVHVFQIDEEGNWADDMFDKLTASDAIIYGSPTYMGGPAWQFKKFADASSKLWFEQKLKDKLAAGFTTSASTIGDKPETLNYFFTLSQQHGQIWIGTGLMPNNDSKATREDTNWIGSFSGAAAIARSDLPPEEMPNAGDIELAKALGERVANWAKKLG